MAANETALCQYCRRTIDHRQIAAHSGGDPIFRWCHDSSLGAPTFHCPTGGDGHFGNPSRRHAPLAGTTRPGGA